VAVFFRDATGCDSVKQESADEQISAGAETMRGTNKYWRQLSVDELVSGAHRDVIGGLWDDMGQRQFEFLRTHGLTPQHRLLDLGCGALRGGLHFVRYLDVGNYYGMDINTSLLEGGRIELERAGLAQRNAHLLCDAEFALIRFGQRFDMLLAVSVFTHRHLDQIQRCLVGVAQVLADGGVFYATYFPAGNSAAVEPITHSPGEVVEPSRSRSVSST
jgi:SAM-dependent methyltransferase